MSNEEILKRCIAKAVDGGWLKTSRSELDIAMNYWNIPEMIITQEYYRYIFSHKFAKAFWGEGKTLETLQNSEGLKDWEYYLQQAVLYENPLEYLAEFI